MFADAAYFNEVWQDTPDNAKIKEKTGVTFKVDFPTTDDSNQRISMLVASDDLPDILMMGRRNTMWQEVIQSGKMNDMEELINAYAPGIRETVDPEVIELSRHTDGKLYYITNYTATHNFYDKAAKYNQLVGAN